MTSSRLHRPLYQGVLDALIAIFCEARYSDKVLERLFKANKKWGGRDRRFVAQSVYDMVRWWRPLVYSALEEEDIDFSQLSRDQVSRVAEVFYLLQGVELPKWMSFPEAEQKLAQERWEKAQEVPALKHSLPNWWEARGQEWLGERWPGLIEALNQRAPVYLRTNTLKVSPEELLQSLKQEGLECETVPHVPGALKLRERTNVFVTESFRLGLFEVQDAGSQCLAPLLKVSTGDRVVDACAGAGGKTLHMASMMGNKGKIIALDIHAHKLEELKRRARRNSVDIVETRVIESRKVIKRLKGTADAVLLDVPCSGSGVLRRNPDTKWKLSEHRLEELVQIQRDILSSYSQMCKMGGRMVYATCSVFPLENQDQVHWFLEQSQQGSGSWELEEELVVHPETSGFDGFYAARLSRKK